MRKKEEEKSLSAAGQWHSPLHVTAHCFTDPNATEDHITDLRGTRTHTQWLAMLITSQLKSQLPPLTSTPLNVKLIREDTRL